MSTLMLCLIFSALMILITKVPVAMAMAEDGGYDNRHPRAQQARLTGFGARALAAHQNMIEAFPVFAAGVLLVMVTGTTGYWVSVLALVFVGARIVYTIFYLGDFPVLRSMTWGVGFAASLGLMLLAVW
ncbi:MAG: MAPEG family protein [Wenzhouxiangellaceae bacterium]